MMPRQIRQENLIYLTVWVVLFMAPLLSLYVRTAGDSSIVFDWSEVFVVWWKFSVYLLLFLAHNFLLAPLLVHRNQRALYFSIMVVVLALFTVYQCTTGPGRRGPRGHGGPHRIERSEATPPSLEEYRSPHKSLRPHDDLRPHDQLRPPRGDARSHEFRPVQPPPIIGEHDIMAIVVLILMFGVNLGLKFYFCSREDQKRIAALEKENLEQQLEYLRYQINPHFFMNTLNNIHALVDIDPAKAQETIVELSKMMRFVLYEGNRTGVPLSRELEFIRTYVKLMQLRYTEKVCITLDLPTEVPDRTIPPLMLIPFIENAFKHGVSYQRDSFIEVKITVDGGELRFICRNSKANNPNEEKGGVGLANVRKRLDLLYDKDYLLHINDAEDCYSVELKIPI